jgi:hypothetical protein
METTVEVHASRPSVLRGTESPPPRRGTPALLAVPLCVFEPEGAVNCGLDKLDFTIKALRLPLGAKPPFIAARTEIPSLLLPGKGPKWINGVYVEPFRFPDHMTLEMQLGGFKSGDGTRLAATGTVGLMRRLRETLSAAGLLADGGDGHGLDQNYVDPTRLSPGVNLLSQSVSQLMEAIEQSRARYIELVSRLFGLRLAPSWVSVRFSRWELTWDRSCQLAKHAPTAFERAWRTTFSMAARSWGDERVTYLHAGDGAAFGLDAGSGPGCLRGVTANEDAARLYAKSSSMLRYEAKLGAPRVKRILRHNPRLDDRPALEADLRALAERTYQPILRAQEALTSPRILNLAQIVRCFIEAGSPRKSVEILDAFLADGKFHHVGGSHYRELRALREGGWARPLHARKGVWGPTPVLARSISMLNLRLQQTVVADDEGCLS